MKNSIKRTIAGAVLGTTLAAGAVALAAAPASAIPITSGATTLSVSAANPGDQFTISNSLTVTPDVNGALGGRFISTYDPAIMDVLSAHVYQNGNDVTSGFNCRAFSSTQFICDPNIGAISVNGFTTFRMDLTAQLKTTATPGATTTVSSMTSLSVNGVDANPQWKNSSAALQVVSTVDTPIIAPAIAGIALLGAAGAGGGIAVGRRKKAKANA